MGLIAGFFYAYACSVMIGLHRTDDRTFIVTMQSINATVRNAAAIVAVRRGSPGRSLLLTAVALYAAAFVVTMGVSVPLNNEFAAAGAPDRIADLAAVRDDYGGRWAMWNLVRTLLSTGALVALVTSLTRTNVRRGDGEPGGTGYWAANGTGIR